MADKPRAIRAAQILAIFTASSASGLALGASVLVVPRLLESPTPLMLRQWRRLSRSPAHAAALALAAAATAPFLFLAGRLPAARAPYLLAAGLCASVLPYAAVVLGPTERRLARRAEVAELQAAGVEVQPTRFLVDRWGLLNLGRAVLMAAAALAGLGASF